METMMKLVLAVSTALALTVPVSANAYTQLENQCLARAERAYEVWIGGHHNRGFEMQLISLPEKVAYSSYRSQRAWYVLVNRRHGFICLYSKGKMVSRKYGASLVKRGLRLYGEVR